MGQEVMITDNIPITILSSMEITSYIKGYHIYKNIWTPTQAEKLVGEMEPQNPVDKYAVAVKKGGIIVGHLPLGKNGKFAKTIFYFLRADKFGRCDISVTGSAVNLKDGDGMQVPCVLRLSGQKNIVDILMKQLM